MIIFMLGHVDTKPPHHCQAQWAAKPGPALICRGCRLAASASGRQGNEPLRFRPVRPCRIICWIEVPLPEIVPILDGARDVQASLGGWRLAGQF
jgi:hypothetical protein